MLAARSAALGTVPLLIALLPLALMAGPVGLLPWGTAVAWYGRIGVRLWRHDVSIVRRARTTYLATLLLGVLQIAYGWFALQAAERSAAAGGGLLGGYGAIPVIAGVLLAVIAIPSLLAVAALAAAAAGLTARARSDGPRGGAT